MADHKFILYARKFLKNPLLQRRQCVSICCDVSDSACRWLNWSTQIWPTFPRLKSKPNLHRCSNPRKRIFRYSASRPSSVAADPLDSPFSTSLLMQERNTIARPTSEEYAIISLSLMLFNRKESLSEESLAESRERKSREESGRSEVLPRQRLLPAVVLRRSDHGSHKSSRLS